MPEVNIKELKDEITSFVKTAHEKMDALEGTGKQTSEGLELLKTDFVKASEQLQQAADKIAAQEADMKALEALMARMPANATKGKDEPIGDPVYRKGFRDYLRKRTGIDNDIERKNVEELISMSGVKLEGAELDEMIIKAGLVGSNPDGGFLAPTDAARFISRRVFETSPIRQVANVISTGMTEVTIILDDQEAGSGWVGEVENRPDTTTPQIGEITIPIHEQYAQPIISQKAIDDVSMNLEAMFQQNVARRFARQENAAFVNGTGVKQPKGILAYASWSSQGQYERDAIEHRETESVGTISGDDFINVQSDLLEDYQANASWMMHRKVWADVMQLKDNENQYLLNPMMLFAGVQMQLLGRPVRFAGDMDSTVAEGNSIAIYGDFREGYTVVDRIGIRVLRDPYTSKPFIRLYTTKRVGGAVTNFQALKVLDVQAS